MTRMIFHKSGCRLLVLVGVLLSLPAVSSGQERALLAFSIRNLAQSIRSNAPVSLECRLEYTAQRLLEGDLQLQLFDGQSPIGIVQIDGLVLSGGDYEFNAMLPPFKAPYQKAIDIYPTFITRTDRIKMEPATLIVSANDQRGTVGMFVIDTSLKSAAQTALENALKPGRFNFFSNLSEDQRVMIDGEPNASPAPQAQQNPTEDQRVGIDGADRIDFYQARYDYSEVPVSALRYCVADLVVVCDETLGKLREKQLLAMEQWVQAGGCACIVPDGQLSAEHLSFLNRLTDVASTKDSAPFISNGKGGLAEREFGAHGYELHHFGLGRVAVVSPQADLDALTDAQIGPLNAFMWRIRAEHSSVLAGEPWELKKRARLVHSSMRGRGIVVEDSSEGFRGYNHTAIPAIHGLMRRTMPKDVRIIPFGLVGSLLVLYVLAIGPGDYFLLGLFKLRKLTWIVFPIVTLAFTLFTVWLSHHYMGSGDEGKPVVFIDMVKGNQVARTTEFSLIFSGAQKQVVDEYDGAIATGINQHDFGGYDAAFSGRGFQSDSGTYTLPVYAGRFPAQYRMIQQVEQWSPRLNRTFRIAPTIQRPDFDWDNPGRDSRFPVGPGTAAKNGLVANVKNAFGTNAAVLVFHMDQIEQIQPGALGRLFNNEQVDVSDPQQRQPTNVLYEACARSRIGLFEVMYQISPTGSDNFEDLTMLDTSDPNQWLLVVITEENDGYKIYRRLYNTGPVADGQNNNPAKGQTAEPQ